jgi:hypothetical protein
MRVPRVQFQLRWLMVAVALLAVLLAWIHPYGVIGLAGMALVVIIPAVLAPPRRRLEVASWASSLQALMPLVYLYATWITAWCVLGHRPRPYLDDPKWFSEVVIVPYLMCSVSLVFGSPICLGTGLLLAVICSARRRIHSPLMILPVAWLTAYVIFRWDPLSVFYWYID